MSDSKPQDGNDPTDATPASGTVSEVTEPGAPAGRTTRRRVLSWTLLCAGVVVLAATGWTAWRAYQAYRHLDRAAEKVAELQHQLSDPGTGWEAASVDATLADLQSEARAAVAAAGDPVVRFASLTPGVGPNLDAVFTVSTTVDSLATTVVPSMIEVRRTLTPSALAPTAGRIDLAPLTSVAPLLDSADTAVSTARRQLDGIDLSAVVGPVGNAVMQLRHKLDSVADVVEPAAVTARLLPDLLGADGERSYLVVFQNLAEPRATGGIFGSYAVLRADRGHLEIGGQGTARSLKWFDPPAASLSDSQRELYGSEMATFPADVNFTPDFPTAARLFLEMYRLRTGSTVDGVLALDPVGLAYLLQGSPPIDVDGASITADNLVPTLLSTVYQRFDGADHDERDTFTADATAAAFRRVTSGDIEPAALFDGVRRAVTERRVLLYSTDDAVQAQLAATAMGGAVDSAAEASNVGVFVNDATASKLGYYLTVEAHLTGGSCLPDGTQQLALQVVLTYRPPDTGLPSYVTGGSTDTPDHAYRIHVLVLAPAGGGLTAVERDGLPQALRPGEDHRRPAGSVAVDLPPGSTSTLTFYLGSGTEVPSLDHTPGVTAWQTSVAGVGCTH